MRTTWQAYGLIAPAGILYALFQLVPILGAFVLSFTSWNGINLSRIEFTGLDNYVRLMQDELFWRAVLHNLIVALLVFVFMTVGSFLIAAIIHAGIRGGAFFRIVFFAPVVISSVAIAMLAIFFFSPSQGLINEALRGLGLGVLAQPWLGSAEWALPAVSATYILQNFGFSVILFLSALTQVNDEMCEAAEVDGASQGRILWGIVLPTIRPIASVVVLLGFINSFRLFDTVYVMTGGGPFHASDTIVTYLYGTAFGGNQVGYANAIGVALFLILCVIAVVQLRLTRERKDVIA
ncbi:sugar ABC transporter permease [Herbiconiux sp. KACC 21604]|uniref:carbohydrate ABC transporter permease n=1 Tax=unclassified Herbiconiux TaxID=2618217 RepID=UPI001492785D|nr:sugar ABC transporter permease [Herbiconiux sp. SALV-R1]QJU55242.1 sugar ABC transporter permease [Herbiconiux sp. SALV-R1]WPO86408.1 sugar ABC transporter permease [Herbiconiux sp. KACC 21604]